MIVTRLIGGLGNQMFQYAAGRALAQRLGVDLYIDRRAFENYETHAFGLQHFAAKLLDAAPRDLPGMQRESRLNRWLRRFSGGAMRVVTESAFTFDPAVLALPDGIYIDGYWQSEQYFADVIQTIRDDFRIATPPSPENQAWLKKIDSVLSVSLHVRRGDYVSNASASAVHGTCDLDYYRRSVSKLVEQAGKEIELFVFSDDPGWVAENLQLPHPTHFVRHNNADTNYEDLRLMSACRHHIIANSTFSWWGAWLDSRSDSIVVAPRQWFRGDKPDARDLVPERWIRL
ncbi:alpha-1,2-fucosyltransferase [Herbaspirillum rhizosphaerae]|uniref:Alpha-1,2-fucosyltransferase n=1 Tax=Herbaspirillum rhizosphaerae TaxID=346179 RepID=A0ABW8Z7V3_9BURK